MNAILIKIFATALTLSQVLTRPEAVKTDFDPVSDRAQVAQILRDGCSHMRRAFDIEDINLDDLIATAMEDPQAVAGDVKVLRGINFGDLHTAYREFCKGETVPASPVDLGEVITYYNAAVADLPDHTTLKARNLPGLTTILDGQNKRFTEVFEPDHRRVWVPIGDVPELVQKAFVAAEDKRFQQHRGIDERGVIRAFVGNLSQPGRPQGGSTITQQVVKNLLVGDDVTYDRKMREMIVASRLEQSLSKSEILELYLNAIYLGRGSWGIEMAARSYFGKPAKELTLAEGALLAGLVKGPNYYNPDRQPERARERYAYVLSRMREDGAITPEQMEKAIAKLPSLVPVEPIPRNPSGRYYVDHLDREARTLASLSGLTGGSYTIHSTVNTALQDATEAALQEGLSRYERSTGRQRFEGAETSLADAVKRIESERGTASTGSSTGRPPWQEALVGARLPLSDVHWPAAIVLPTGARAGALRVGLSDGRILALGGVPATARKTLAPYDVVRVRVFESKAKNSARAELRVPPTVQGAALVLENKTGRILAMAGGFSYPASQLNRTTQAHRQPGSALKPLTYLTALDSGLQPNTLVWDSALTLPPIGGSAGAQAKDYWSPKNYDGRSGGLLTLRQALENSKNLVTARLLDGGIDSDPQRSLKQVCELALEAQIYLECVPYYPFVLGAQPLRLIDLAAFYAAIANEGALPAPYAVEGVEQGGKEIYRHAQKPLTRVGNVDPATFYQLKTMLQGVLARGTARDIKNLAPYVAGKTGTSDDENDAWFVGFTNDVTIAVWVGYDNASGKRTLGRGQTGGKVAVPIFSDIVQAAWTNHAARTALAPPSSQAAKHLVALPINLRSGDRVTEGGRGAFTEYFRTNRMGQLIEAQYRLVSREEAYAARNPDPWAGSGEDVSVYGGGSPYESEPPSTYGQDAYGQPRYNTPGSRSPYPDPRYGGGYDTRSPYPDPRYGGYYGRSPYRQAQPGYGPYGQLPWWEEEAPRRRPRRVDPDYPSGYERIY